MIKYQYLFLPGQYLIGTNGSNTELGKQEFSYRLISYLHVQIAFVREYACTRLTNCFVIAGEHTSRVSRRIQDIKYNCNYKYTGHLEHDWHTHTHTRLLIYSMEKGITFIWIRHCFKMSSFYIIRWRNNQSSSKVNL